MSCLIILSDVLRSVNPLLTATFTSPENMGTAAATTLWMLPLAVSISVIYKVLKLPQIRPAVFLKETLVLFFSIVIFIVVSALVLWVIAWLFV
jgi:hypothetical protein